MKKLLWILLASVAVVGCKKKNVDQVSPANDNEIKIGSTQGSISKAIDNSNQFVASSKIGVFSVEKSKFAANANDAFTNPKQANVGYIFGGFNGSDPVTEPSLPWTPLSTSVLTWQFTTPGGNTPVPVVLVAYHPYDKDLEANSKRVDDVMPFEIAVDQTSEAALNGADLMWAASTGKASGGAYETLKPGYSDSDVKASGIFKSQDLGQAINMNFHHMLTKLDFKVGFYKTATGTEIFASPSITKIEVTGPKITNKGELNLRTGVYTATSNNTNTNGESSWTGAHNYTANINDTKATIEAYENVCQLITAPATFDNTSEDNQLKFYVEYKYKKTAAAQEETLKKVYTFPLNNSKYTFNRNDINNYQVALNLSSSEVYITSTIVKWNDVNHEIEGN